MSGNEPKLYKCNFCGKTRKQVRKLIAGPNVYICDECIALCLEMCYEPEEEGHPVTFGDFDIFPKGSAPLTEKANSIFGRRRFRVIDDFCFYLGPFMEPFNAIYKDHVSPTLVKSGFFVERGDEIFSTRSIIDDIWEGINSASLIVADLSGKNPNVMYEVGIAHTLGKPVLLMSQSVDDIPFDLRHRRCLIYEYTPPGCRKLEAGVSEAVKFFRLAKHDD